MKTAPRHSPRSQAGASPASPDASRPSTTSGGRRRLKRPGVVVLGITGEVAAGKSRVARELSQRLPIALVINADQVAHDQLGDPEVIAALARRFGPTILSNPANPSPHANDGGSPVPSVNRRVLGRLVFADPSARHDLETILHPPMKRWTIARLDELAAARSTTTAPALMLLDAPTLFEAGWDDLCDLTLTVRADQASRERRAAQRGWSAADLESRDRAQWSGDRKASAADLVFDNSDLDLDASSPSRAEAAWDQLAQSLLQRVSDSLENSKCPT